MPTPTEQELRAVYVRAVIIHVFLMLSVLSYIIVAEYIRMYVPYHFPMAYEGSPYVYVRYGVLAVSLLFFPLSLHIGATVVKGADEEALPGRLVTKMIIGGALFEMVGMFGLLLFLLWGQRVDVYVFAWIALVGQVMFFPRYRQWEEMVLPRKW